MIEVEVSQFFAIVVVTTAVLAGLSVGWDLLHERRAAREVRRKAMRCRDCGAVFRREESRLIQSCPQCQSPTQSGRDRRLG